MSNFKTQVVRIFVRFTSSQAKIKRLVPLTRRVNLVQDGEVTRDVPLSSINLQPNEQIQVLNISPNGKNEDPTVTAKITQVDLKHQLKHINIKKKSHTKSKPAEVKDIRISWNISLHDLQGPKAKAIESVLTRGHFLQVHLESNRKSRNDPWSDNIQEKRNQVLQEVHAIVKGFGKEAKQAEGSLRTRMLLFFRPHSRNDQNLAQERQSDNGKIDTEPVSLK